MGPDTVGFHDFKSTRNHERMLIAVSNIMLVQELISGPVFVLVSAAGLC